MRFWIGHRLPGGFWAGMSTYGRRPHRAVRSAARTTGTVGCVGWLALIVVIVLVFEYWYISLPVLALTALAVGITVHRYHVHRRAAPPPVQPPPPG
ncbi:MAG: hypothetical protein JOZ46_00190 [Candidatus Dormibacteraeota bacterium]|nr:hypothetical protein [Candidatus Dormibacteraeota bacterium]MBV9524211.1 hypothetical protein [Candidatus Dormibacteraeota bacterium]